MREIAPYLLERAVAAICPDIEFRVASARRKVEERDLWWELSSCILSSQVPYALAIAAANTLDRAGLMLELIHDSAALAPRITSLLRNEVVVEGRQRAYRFPAIRGRQLAEARGCITRSGGSLNTLLQGLGSPEEARGWLVTHISGVGPKQASMFLRNIGFSYDLAVLDRHVVRYMCAVGIESNARAAGGFELYRRREVKLAVHARRLGFPVGLFDWAIWIVMRAARQLQCNSVNG